MPTSVSTLGNFHCTDPLYWRLYDGPLRFQNVDAPMPLVEFKGAALRQRGKERGPGVWEPKHVSPFPRNYFLRTPLHRTNDDSVFRNEKEVTHACYQISQSDCKSFSRCWLHQNSSWYMYIGVPVLLSARYRKTVLSSYASSCASFLPTVIHEANYRKHPARRAA